MFIAHLSDIHIRKFHRHKEYREVFKQLYKQLEEIEPDCIVITGDLVHGKIDMSPELTKLIAEFLLKLTYLTKHLIIIPGNHDCLLYNKSRLDSLSPIIDLVKEIRSNIYYWPESGKYEIDDISFGVLSIFDMDEDKNQMTENLPDPSEMTNKYKVALYHGGCGTFTVDSGMQMTDKNVSIDTFRGYDIAMLGDIHLKQKLSSYDKEFGIPACEYPGSLIQQNFIEELSHGFLVWDLETHNAKYCQIKNDYGFKTLNIINGILKEDIKYIPPKGKIRIKYWNTTVKQLKDIQLDLYKQYPEIKDIKIERQDTVSLLDDKSQAKKFNIGDVRDITYQNELITNFLKHNIENIDDNTIKRICAINKVTNNTPEIYDKTITRNVSWKLKSLEFDNMFCYKEGNKIDFASMNGVVGIIGKNKIGKSSILDIISYAIFDTCGRTFKAIEVLNKRKQDFKVKLNVEINGTDYWVERIGVLKSRKNRKTNKIVDTCPVSVKFYMIEDGQKIDLTGAARKNTQYGKGTNEEIRKLLGTFDDFILTSLSLQDNNANFINKKQADRKQILSQFMDIDIFEKLNDIAKIDSASERALYKAFQKKDSYKQLSIIDEQLEQSVIKRDDISDEVKKYDVKIDNKKDIKLNLVKELWKIDDVSVNIDELEIELKDFKHQKIDLEIELNDSIKSKEELRPKYLELNENINKFDKDEISENYKLFNEIHQSITDTKNLINSTEHEISMIAKSIEGLDKYKYDKECEYCINNAQEHIEHKQKLDENLTTATNQKFEYLKTEKLLNIELSKVKDADKIKTVYDTHIDQLNEISNSAIKFDNTISVVTEKLNHLKTNIKETKQKIKTYNDNEQKILENNKINEKIEIISHDISNLEHILQDITTEHNTLISEVISLEKEKEQIEKDIKEQIDIEQKINDYDMYLLSTSKNGVPYDLIAKTLPFIKAEINEVLYNMSMKFTISLEMDGKNINGFICYDDVKWPLELISGMEKFICSLAIRIGLINISNLPKSTFLVIDEGFGTLDDENITNIEGAFEYLKNQFDFVVVISHIDVIKDYLDTYLPIEVDDDGYSTIVA